MLKLLLEECKRIAPDIDVEPESLLTPEGVMAYARAKGAHDFMNRVSAALKQKYGIKDDKKKRED